VVDEDAREVLRVLLETAAPLRMLPDLVAQDTDPSFSRLSLGRRKRRSPPPRDVGTSDKELDTCWHRKRVDGLHAGVESLVVASAVTMKHGCRKLRIAAIQPMLRLVRHSNSVRKARKESTGRV
jgi:hypothetical protein